MAKGLIAIAMAAISCVVDLSSVSVPAIFVVIGIVIVLAAIFNQRVLASVIPNSTYASDDSQMKNGGLSGQTVRKSGSSYHECKAQ